MAATASLRSLVPVGDFGRTGLPGMFCLAAPDRIREVLTGAGFTGVAVRQVEAYGEWGRGAADAAEFVLGTGPAVTSWSRPKSPRAPRPAVP
ncbi:MULTISPECIES: hypothetical protein [Streptomyces]|uniref:hypothetical protein n=1 Tax=Streptomyces TaxID=1883 RepID=UPI000A8A1E85